MVAEGPGSESASGAYLDHLVRLRHWVEPLQLPLRRLSLHVLESAPGPRTTVQSPLRWSGNADWKLDYSNPERLSSAEIARLRSEFDRGKQTARAMRESKLIA